MNRSAHRALHNYVFHFQERRKKERSVAARPAETVGLEDAVADRFQSRRSRLWRKEDRSRTAHETGKRIARRRHRPEDDASNSGSGAAEARPACAKYRGGSQSGIEKSASPCSAHSAVSERVLIARAGDAPSRDFRRWREWHGQDDHHWKTRAPPAPGWPERRPRRSRHFSRRGDRAAWSVGFANWR